MLGLGVLDCGIMKRDQYSEFTVLIPCDLQLFLDQFSSDLDGQSPGYSKKCFGGPKTPKRRYFKWATSKKRLIWSARTQYFTILEWSQFLWTDECRFSLFTADGRTRVWRFPGYRNSQENIVEQSLRVWGGFIMIYRTNLVFIDGPPNSDFFQRKPSHCDPLASSIPRFKPHWESMGPHEEKNKKKEPTDSCWTR